MPAQIEVKLPVNYEKLSAAERRLVREEYVKRQDGKCCHCGALLSGPSHYKTLAKPVNKKLFPENFFKWPVHLHHSHDTNMTIGAVHAHCNAVLWQYYGE